MIVAQLRGYKFVERYDTIAHRTYWMSQEYPYLDTPVNKVLDEIAKLLNFPHRDEYIASLPILREKIFKRISV
jgi:hypothetical protein